MLIDKIQSCTASINELSILRSNALNLSSFESAVNKLSTIDAIAEDFVSTIEEMNKTSFCKTNISEEELEKLQSAIVTCAQAVNDRKLSSNDVTALTSVFQSQKKVLAMLWQTTAKAHVDPVKSFLGVIQSFVPNKDEVANLIKALNSGSTAEPSAPIVKTLVENINKANAITSGFQMSDGIRKFLQKAKNGSATFADITPDVSAWIKEHSLSTKIKISF